MIRHRACSRGLVAVVVALVLLTWLCGVPPAVRWPARRSGPTYSKTLVVASLEKRDISWLEGSRANFDTAIYIVDNPSLSPEFRVPKNKGREAMVYLTYIIEHYDELADITLFTHPDLRTWHNSDPHDRNLLTMIESLSNAHVVRQGYFNLRCDHDPGCPDWIFLNRTSQTLPPNRSGEEQAFTLEIWDELHPGVPPPSVIAHPCCAQFAVTRERIHSNPRATYIRYRDWLLATGLDDSLSGRVMEYSWQYIFTGVSNLCPDMRVCYCDGYGLCFGGAQQFDAWMDARERHKSLTQQAARLQDMPGVESHVRELRMRADGIQVELDIVQAEAFKRGSNPRLRAEEVGRPWKPGDGY